MKEIKEWKKNESFIIKLIKIKSTWLKIFKQI